MPTAPKRKSPKTRPAVGTANGVFAQLDAHTRDFYRMALSTLSEEGVPFLVGGAYAFERYAGIERHTKDFDVFVRPVDRDRALAALATIGCQTEISFPHWLAKGFCADDFVDVIYSSGNGIADVDEEWFVYAVDDVVLGMPVKLIPAEEMLWQKAMIMERERFDGADIAHILRARAEKINWERLLHRFGPYWRILLSHLILFGFIYPSERDRIPKNVMRELLQRLRDEERAGAAEDRVCQGTLISREQYLVDVKEWGYRDARLPPRGPMSRRDVSIWTAAIGQ